MLDESPGEGAARRGVDRERVEVLYRKAPIAQWTVLVNSALLVSLLHAQLSPLVTGLWLASTWLVTLGRYLDTRAYRARPDGDDPLRWERRFALGSGANGIAWGLGAAAFTSDSLPLNVLLVFVVGGMVAGASVSNATSRAAFAAYSAPALLPLCAALAWQGETTHLLMAAMLLLFGASMAMLARQGGIALTDAIELRQRNTALLTMLEQRTAERGIRLRLLLDQAGMLVIVADPETMEIVELSDNAAHVLDCAPTDLPTTLGQLSILPELEGEALWRAILDDAAIGNDQIVQGTGRFSGEPAHVELSVAMHSVDGRAYAFIVAKDATARRNLEEQLAQANHLASLGTLAAGVAHEINNPLTYIVDNLHHLREQLDGSTLELLRLVDESTEGADRIRRIVRDLVASARTESETIERVDLREVIRACLNMSDAEIRHRAKLELRLDSTPPVRGNALRLTQVLLNLLVNAAQAIPEGSADTQRITLGTRYDREKRRIAIFVSDTGRGISEEHRARIFDPFFTTKAPGQGTGLGLSVCHGIVTSLGGTLSVTSDLGLGSTFTVELPTDELAPPPAPPLPISRLSWPARSSMHHTGSLRVLVIDDDLRVARAVKRILIPHDVHIVTRAREALALLSSGTHYDVSLCDLMMPDMTGVDFFEEVRREFPEIGRRIVFATGGAFTNRAREFLGSVDNPCLDKPFDVTTLRSTVVAAATARSAPPAS